MVLIWRPGHRVPHRLSSCHPRGSKPRRHGAFEHEPAPKRKDGLYRLLEGEVHQSRFGDGRSCSLETAVAATAVRCRKAMAQPPCRRDGRRELHEASRKRLCGCTRRAPDAYQDQSSNGRMVEGVAIGAEARTRLTNTLPSPGCSQPTYAQAQRFRGRSRLHRQRQFLVIWFSGLAGARPTTRRRLHRLKGRAARLLPDVSP